MTNKFVKLLENHLKGRGRITTTTGETLQSPTRMFKYIGEEIIHLLNTASYPLSIKEISNYLGINIKSVSKTLRQLFIYQGSNNHISKTKRGRVSFYSCQIPIDMSIPNYYKMIKYLTGNNHIEKISKVQSPNVVSILTDLLNLPNSGNFEIELTIKIQKK